MMIHTHNVEAVLHHTPDDRFFGRSSTQQSPENDTTTDQLRGAFLPTPSSEQHEIIHIRYASTTSDCCSIRASRHGSQLRLELVDEYEDDLIGETATLLDAVPTQGEIFDWLMSIRTRCGEPYIIPPIVPTLTEAEAATFIQFDSEAYPGLSQLYRLHLATIFTGVLH